MMPSGGHGASNISWGSKKYAQRWSARVKQVWARNMMPGRGRARARARACARLENSRPIRLRWCWHLTFTCVQSLFWVYV